MASSSILIILILSLLIPPNYPTTLPQQQPEKSSISTVISTKGLDFIKSLLISKAISSIKDLQLPRITTDIRFPVLGSVHIALSNIEINKVSVLDSIVKPGLDYALVIVVNGASVDLSMNWSYEYATWIAPVHVQDKGTASIKVEGVEVGLTLGLENQNGTLKLSLIDCGCYVKDISIKLDGGASWFYQGMINAFEDQIGAAVENAITQKLEEGIIKLDSFLQSLPKYIAVDDIASLNATFVNQPLLNNSSIGFEINGLFAPRKEVEALGYYNRNTKFLHSCTDPSKMLGILLDEAVFNSASAIYYASDYMQWIVDKIPDQSLLNTAGWRFIIPQLYKKYPNHDLDMNISLSSPPVIKISERDIDSTVYSDLIIDVLEEEEVIPVACISLVISASASVKISGNNLAGSVKLNDFSMSLKWSKIGTLRMYLIQPVLWTIIETVVLPYANLHLGKGFPLPIIHDFTLENAEIVSSDSKIMVCSDVTYDEKLSYGMVDEALAYSW